MKFVQIINLSNPTIAPILARYCQSFFCQLRGLMFTRHLPVGQGLLLVQHNDSKMNASIHMMFMEIDLAVIWIDSKYEVVDKVLARRWHLSYIPKRPAQFVLETGTSHLPDYNIGDKVRFDEQRVDARVTE